MSVPNKYLFINFRFEDETIAVEKLSLRTWSTTDSNDQATKNRITISKLLEIRWNENKQVIGKNLINFYFFHTNLITILRILLYMYIGKYIHMFGFN